MKKILTILLFLLTLQLSAQDRKALRGAVVMGESRVPGVFIINKSSGMEAKTDSRGNFTIQAKNGDRLTVHSAFTEDRDFYVGEEAFKKVPYLLAVEGKSTQLETVIVNDTLSIIQPVIDAKEYTVAERRVNAGGTVKLRTMEEQGGGVAIPLDAVLNGGKAKTLKRELATEQLEKVVARIQSLYTNEEIVQNLHIPAGKEDAFVYFAAEDETLTKTFNDNNTDQARLRLAELSQEYMGLQAEEEKKD
jgi:hypothetical protein